MSSIVNVYIRSSIKPDEEKTDFLLDMQTAGWTVL